MRFDCKDLGFYFQMDNDNFVSLNDAGKIKYLNFTQDQLKQNLYTFVEVLDDNMLSGRYIQITLDSGYYPTEQAVKEGKELCIANIKKNIPGFELINETTIMPNDVKNCIWKRPDGSLLSQYYMSKNGYMFCVAGGISTEHDDLDNLMAFICMSVVSVKKPEDIEHEEMQNVTEALSQEINHLVESGMSIEEATKIAKKKFGIEEKVDYTRSRIKSFLNDNFKQSTKYYEAKKAPLEKKWSLYSKLKITDLRFMFALKDLLVSVMRNFGSIEKNESWKPSPRQEYLLEQNIPNKTDDVMEYQKCKNVDEAKYACYIESYEFVFWEIWDYFDDYGNKNEIVCQEEFKLIIPHIKRFIEIMINDL